MSSCDSSGEDSAHASSESGSEVSGSAADNFELYMRNEAGRHHDDPGSDANSVCSVEEDDGLGETVIKLYPGCFFVFRHFT